MVRWWPPVGVAAMALLGWSVGTGSTPVDDWFQRARGGGLAWLLFFTDQRTVAVILLGALAFTIYRQRWPLAVLIVVTPVVAVWLSRVFKEWFGREKDGAVAYPSGHTTLMVVALGLVILLVGARLWIVIAATVWALLGMLGQAVTYHYFTDAIGGLLLGSSLVCVVAVLCRSILLTGSQGHAMLPER
ncbi:Phosphoesterase PA-phosphatase related protein [uncultured Mycobacterium sp.]|uniref:Phosphoesterase PA-phosphatase related protein n=1 Tax=uncultured Mycobacterium sp. TaxID=171292 RepID=A0A1Y5PHK4_9MYCO|nr:Phosphoesterase PA-phosphatase related protein [uncultured Mycobacterium sp.]